MARVRLSLSHRFVEDSPTCLHRLLLALPSNWVTSFMRRIVFVFSFLEVFAFAFVVAFRQAAFCCLTAASALVPMAQMKPRSSRPTAVMILRRSLPAADSFM